jgi:uncharacterized protein
MPRGGRGRRQRLTDADQPEFVEEVSRGRPLLLTGRLSDHPRFWLLADTQSGVIRSMDVGDLLRRCRLEAGLSQRDLAGLAGTSQPAPARYEGGRATPSLRTLEHILAVLGKELRLVADDLGPRGQRSPATRALSGKWAQVRRILKRHGVQRADVFGSIARGEDRDDSDIDLLVDMPSATLIRLADLRADLEDELGVPVDVTTTALLTEEGRQRAATEAVPCELEKRTTAGRGHHDVTCGSRWLSTGGRRPIARRPSQAPSWPHPAGGRR